MNEEHLRGMHVHAPCSHRTEHMKYKSTNTTVFLVTLAEDCWEVSCDLYSHTDKVLHAAAFTH